MSEGQIEAEAFAEAVKEGREKAKALGLHFAASDLDLPNYLTPESIEASKPQLVTGQPAAKTSRLAALLAASSAPASLPASDLPEDL